MLESVNDYMAILALVAVIVMVVGAAIYVANLKSIRKNVRKEMDYYHFDNDKLINNNSKGKLKNESK